ncbi:hypothetical protein QW060_22365 [Myroides ceti]|uniref:Uncharacterized protein n=1 Tax=Paenimyroides ceti TaxID=395087 RepID=A0ABT8CR75_9FLAO|nr:hypothetical protein [Paenimyroides ceti]MDN3706710.1 hypothetical protein [Paenimyroides ceti]MDN3709700.1 hypothetical protein [Paenimyroides ceti]
MKLLLSNIIFEIRSKEEKLSSEFPRLIDEAYQMIFFYKNCYFLPKSIYL